MAVTSESLGLTEAYRQSQVALRSLTAQDIAAILPLLEFENIAGTWPQIEAAIVSVVDARRKQSVALSHTFYSRLRRAEGVLGAITPAAAAPLDVGLLVRNLRIVGPGRAGKAMALGRTNVASTTFVNLEGETSRNVLNGGRSAQINTVKLDRKAVGWVRVTDGNPCAFCAMLASRGPVYKSKASATSGSFYSETVKDFRAHPHCACVSKAVYRTADPWPGRAKEFQDLWNSSTKSAAGKASGKDALNLFRTELRKLYALPGV